MKNLRRTAIAAAAVLSSMVMTATAQVNVDAFTKRDSFESIKISPTGEYFAATVPFEDRTALVVMGRADKKLLGTFQLGRDTAIYSFDWVSPDRVLIGAAQKFGELDKPQPTGELYAMDASGGKPKLLIGQRVSGNLGSRIGTKRAGMLAAFLLDDLPEDDKNVLVTVMPFGADPFTRVEKMDVYTGQRQVVTRVPVRRANFVTDHQGDVRFANGSESDNVSKLYYRKDEKSDWVLLNDEASSGITVQALGFSADGNTAYLQSEMKEGPDAVVAYDIASGTQKEVLRDKVMSPQSILYKPGTSVPIGVSYNDGKPRLAFIDPASQEAKLYRSLQGAFGDNAATITSSTQDGHYSLVGTWSDRNPGDFYLFDSQGKKADHVISAAEWLDPGKMSAQKPFEMRARDGLVLKGFVTAPSGSAGKPLPMVVMPHGGPFGISDNWGFDQDVQMLTAAGYAVLQVNFRGSGSRGKAFEDAGAKQWGLAMQDDVTDATRWAIQEGIADPQKVCIYGASYGAFAALMGVAKEPALYKCAAGNVGVYDLPQLVGEEVRKGTAMENWTREWVGEDAGVLASNSPTRRAGSIKVPVFLAAGREDPIAPVEHTERMERALKAAGVPLEVVYYAGEGHGYYKPENRKDFATRLLAFLAKQLGGGVAATAGAGGAAR